MSLMKEKIRRFMIGRYGADDLTRFLLYVCVGVMVVNLLIRSWIFNILAILLLVLCYVRMFSKSSGKRYQENQIYLGYKNKVVSFFHREKAGWKQRKTHHIYRCPQCRQKIRVPRGKGRIEVTCPKCNTKFIKKS